MSARLIVAASLVRHLRQMGRLVDAIKPVVSGFDPAHAAASDPGILLNALGLPVTEQEIDRISPWRFRAALSPDLAAEREGRRIDVDTVIKYCQTAIDQRRDILLIEGVGGIMVPLDGERTILDVMMALQLPLILVAGSYLGTISHTLTALDALFRRGMRVVAIVVSETPGSTVPLDDTVAAIARFAEPVIGLPRQRQDVPPQPGGRPSKTADALGRIFRPIRQRYSDRKLFGEIMHLHHGFHCAFEIKQRVQKKRQQRRAGAQAHPAQKQADDENLQHAGPIILDVQPRPNHRDRDDRQPSEAFRARPAAEQKAAEHDLLAGRRDDDGGDRHGRQPAFRGGGRVGLQLKCRHQVAPACVKRGVTERDQPDEANDAKRHIARWRPMQREILGLRRAAQPHGEHQHADRDRVGDEDERA